MRCIRLLFCLAVTLFVPALPCAADSPTPPAETPVPAPQKAADPAMSADMQKAQTQLDEFAQKRLALISDKIRPSRDQKEVIQAGTEYTARYLEVDMASLTTEITAAQGSGAKYIGSIIYYEQIFESRGSTKEAALAGEFELVKLRHITELFRYNRGRWID